MWSVLHGRDMSPYMSCPKVTNPQDQSGHVLAGKKLGIGDLKSADRTRCCVAL
jgi:hypothetical protein